MSDKANILMVEDSEKLLELNCRILQNEERDVHAAASLAQAREILKTVKVDLAILDIDLPDGNGIDFADELRELYGTPIIFLTGRTGEDNVIAGLNKGALSYITKPYDMNFLKTTVTDILTDIKKKTL